MLAILIVGATRGLGAALVQYYSSNPFPGTSNITYATTRLSAALSDDWTKAQNVHWLLNIDLEKAPEVARKPAQQITVEGGLYSNSGKSDNKVSESGLAGAEGSDGRIDVVIITADYFATEQHRESKWDEEVKMYTLRSITTTFVVEVLDKQGCPLDSSIKIILVGSESGSITLRHEQEGDDNFGLMEVRPH